MPNLPTLLLVKPVLDLSSSCILDPGEWSLSLVNLRSRQREEDSKKFVCDKRDRATYVTVFWPRSVQTLDSAIHRINHYPVDKYWGNQLRYPLDSHLSGG